MTTNGVASANTYVLGTGAGSAAARLRMLDEVYGASTRQMLLDAGLKPGMRALDMACGVGTLSCSISRVRRRPVNGPINTVFAQQSLTPYV